MKKKGFTLIELLAVIIILAVIALIATPIVLNIIEKVRINAAESSAKGYAKAVDYTLLNKNLFSGGFSDGEYDVEENELGVIYQGVGPSEGYFVVENNMVTYGELCINGYPIKYENGYGIYAPEEVICSGVEPAFKEPEGTILSELCKNEAKLNEYDSITNYKIKKVEDLVCLSNLSSSGKTFEGKTVMLLSNIDIKDSNSYSNSNDTSYGDINGNGTIEGLLTELTTSKGFLPIGSSTTPFKGSFEGYAFTLSNLYINRTDMNNVGLFGYVNGGNITGLNVNSVNITGKDNVGGVVGYITNTSTIKEIVLNGSISGTNYIGGIAGYNSQGNTNKITSVLLSDVNVTGKNDVGGIGGGYAFYINGVIESGTISVTNGTSIGKVSSGNSPVGTAYVSTLVTSTATGNDGTSYLLDENVMGLYDHVLDTYIGGDNDSSGYYLDYESDDSKNVVVKSIVRQPLLFKLKGEGTEESPYLINNTKDWKNATLKVTDGYYFKLTNDIDFKNEKFYMLGTVTNNFNGTLDGNFKTILNLKVTGVDNSGLIGYSNGGTVKGLNIKDPIITGRNNVGTIVGYSKSSKIIGINIDNTTVNGNQYVGGVTGYVTNSSTINEVALNGNITGTNNYVGGIAGYNSQGNTNKITSVILNANVTGKNDVGGIGGGYAFYINGVIESGTIAVTNGTSIGKVSSGNSPDGTAYVSTLVTSTATGNVGISYVLDKNVMGLYDGALDTYIGGDNDSSGYYLDYENEDSTKVVVKSVELEPLEFKLKGSGTEEDPYLIANASDWKNATLKVKGIHYFKLTNDIDFENEKFYMLGTANNPFDGVLDGDFKTISNVIIPGSDYAGLIGYSNGGTVKGLNIKDSIITGRNNVGTISGYSKSSKIIGINIENTTVNGNQYVGGVTGYVTNSSIINEIALNGNITGTNNYVGGIAGYNSQGSSNKITSVILNANVTGKNDVGGIGGGYAFYITGIIESGTIAVTNGTSIGKVSSGNSPVGTAYVSTLVTSTATGNVGISYSGDDINDLEYYSSLLYNGSPIIESSSTGDVNGTGYYFDYGNDGYIEVVPVE